MNHVSSPALRASTSTTRPTKETTYLPNRPFRRNQLLRTSSMIGILCSTERRSSGLTPPASSSAPGRIREDGPDLVAIAQRAAGIGHHQVAFTQAVAHFGVGVGV